MQPKPRVYVVDDDPAVSGALASLIRVMGFDVETFASAEEFLDLLAPENQGCLVLDVRLPGMSGLDLQKKLVRQSCRLPLIFVTGHADADAATQAMRLGAIGFLEKPFPAQALLDHIQKALASTARDMRAGP